MERVRTRSPITYAANMKTPTLILSNLGDYRVTIIQSYKLFHALRDAGVQTRFFAYPSPGTTRRTRFGTETRWTLCYDAVYSVGDLSGRSSILLERVNHGPKRPL